MSNINNFSSSVDVTPSNNGETVQDTDASTLRIEDWNSFPRAAFTFNGDSEDVAKQLYEALKTHKSLRFTTGVLEHEENRKIQENMRNHMERLYGKEVRYEITGGHYEYTIFELVEPKQQNPQNPQNTLNQCVSLNQQKLLT